MEHSASVEFVVLLASFVIFGLVEAVNSIVFTNIKRKITLFSESRLSAWVYSF